MLCHGRGRARRLAFTILYLGLAALVCHTRQARGTSPTIHQNASSDPAARKRQPHRAPPPKSRARELPSGPFVLDDREQQLHVLVYPPARDDSAKPITVMLHGMCDTPENECPYFADAVTPYSWLVCPAARGRCSNGGSIWDQRYRHKTLEDSLHLVETHYPQHVAVDAPRTLIGFSLGGIFGMDVAHRGQGRYERVILIGAKVYPDARLLEQAGVSKLILAAGDYDMMSRHMKSVAHSTERHGFPALFLSLGKVGHRFPDDLTERMTLALKWTGNSGVAPLAPNAG